MENRVNYEMMVIFSPSIGEAKIDQEVQELKDLLTSNGGTITNEDFWGLREFSYTIKKENSGYYLVLNFNMDGRALKSLEKSLNLNQSILRYLVLKTPSDYQLKSLDSYREEAQKLAEETKKAEEAKQAESKKPRAAAKATIETSEAPKKETKKTPEKLAEVDEKLKGIIDDPDITL